MLSEEEKKRIEKVDLDIPREVIDEGFGPFKCPTCGRDVPSNYGYKCNECGQKLVTH